MSRVAPPGAKAPGRGAWASSPRDCPTPTAGSARSRGAGKGQMRTHLSRPSDDPQSGGRVAPGPDPRSGKCVPRVVRSTAKRSACAAGRHLPERSEGPQRTGALAPEGRVGRPARKARPDPRKEGFSQTRRAIYRPKATAPEATAQRFSAKFIQERHAEIMLHRRSYTHHQHILEMQ